MGSAFDAIIQGKSFMRSLKVAACYLGRNLERGWGRLRKRSLNVLNLMGSKSSRTTVMLVALLGLSPMTYGLKEVVSVRLDPSTIAPGDAFVIYVTAQYESSNSGGRSDDDYATTQYTLDGTSSCINNADATLGWTPYACRKNG